MKRKSHPFSNLLYQIGGARVLDWAWRSDRLTVLAHHRINDINAPDFMGLKANVSASPEQFAQQIEYVARHFNVIDLATLRDHVIDGKPLPPRPLLITFDDGYLDNYENAYPILKAHGLPAVIFLVTRMVGSDIWPWWDEVVYCFEHTTCTQAVLPVLGETRLTTPDERNAAANALSRRLKLMSDEEKYVIMQDLPELLGVELPASRLFMDWDQARELVANGIACQSHTTSHPILTRVPESDLRCQFADSRVKLEAELGKHIYAFAYPNGMPTDFDETSLRMLREANYEIAFTLIPGPMKARDIRRSPLLIPRIYLSHHDSFPIFIMKIMGLPSISYWVHRHKKALTSRLRALR